MNHENTLTAQLADFKSRFINRAPVERVAMMESATANLKASGIESHAKKTGDAAPDAYMQDATGTLVSLSSLWARGPLIVIFYRGGWCPYCNLELRAWQKHLSELKELGATLVAISPQTPDNSLSTIEKNELRFPVLSDSNLNAASRFGIAFPLPLELVELYGTVGNNLPEINGNGEWILPVPATFVIDTSGTIRFAHVEADYRERAEPLEVLNFVRQLSN